MLGQPLPLQRPRVFKDSRGQSRAVTPARSREYRYAVQAAAKAAIKAQGWKKTDRPVRLTVAIYRSSAREADLTNILKAIEDSINGLVWDDDSQVVEIAATKEVRCQNPRAEVEIATFE